MTRRVTRKRLPPQGPRRSTRVVVKHNALSVDDCGTAVDNLCMIPAEGLIERKNLLEAQIYDVAEAGSSRRQLADFEKVVIKLVISCGG